MIDIQQKKHKIIKFLETSGPSLPVQVARAIQMDPVFASAILSELLSSKQIKTSSMKVGSSPLYLIPGQEKELEKKTDHLKPIEKEAQEKLKSKKIILDEQEEPSIRVALRNIKDFAIPFKFKDKITWKYAFIPEEEIKNILFPKKEIIATPVSRNTKKKIDPEPKIPKAWEIKKEEIIQAKEQSKKIKNILEKEKPIEKNIKKIEESKKSNETFLKEIEMFLEKHSTRITEIEEVDKKKVIAITQTGSNESMLFAFNKKRISEIELMKCYKYAKKKNLPYHIITKDNPTKKMQETINAYKKLIKIESLNNQKP